MVSGIGFWIPSMEAQQRTMHILKVGRQEPVCKGYAVSTRFFCREEQSPKIFVAYRLYKALPWSFAHFKECVERICLTT